MPLLCKYICINLCPPPLSPQASGPSPKNKKPPSKPVAGGGGKKPTAAEAKRNGKQAGNSNGNVEVSEDDSASANSTPKKGGGAKEPPSRKRKGEESPAPSQAPPTPQSPSQESPVVCVKRAKTARDNNRDLGLCRYCTTVLHHKPLSHFLSTSISTLNQRVADGNADAVCKCICLGHCNVL